MTLTDPEIFCVPLNVLDPVVANPEIWLVTAPEISVAIWFDPDNRFLPSKYVILVENPPDAAVNAPVILVFIANELVSIDADEMLAGIPVIIDHETIKFLPSPSNDPENDPDNIELELYNDPDIVKEPEIIWLDLNVFDPVVAKPEILFTTDPEISLAICAELDSIFTISNTFILSPKLAEATENAPVMFVFKAKLEV